MALNEKTKEAIAIILDVGPSMDQAPSGHASALQSAISVVTMILQRKLFAKSKDEVSLILFGTPGTANDLAADEDDNESYQNITLAKQLGIINWEVLEYVQKDIEASNMSADFVDALVVGMDHLVKATQGKKGFTSKRIILCTDFGGEFGDDQLPVIVAGLKKADVELNVIGPSLSTGGDDDDDDDVSDNRGASGDGAGPSTSTSSHNGSTKQKTPRQNAGEACIRHILSKIPGACYSFREVIPVLSYFQSRAVKPTAWKVGLDMGSNLTIPVLGYLRVKEQKPDGFKTVCAQNPDEKVTRLSSSHLNDENETEIDQTDIVKGLRYGNTLVPFSADDEANMKFKAEKGFKVLGFTKATNIKRQNYLGDSVYSFVADKDDECAAKALSALVHALFETNMVIIIRRVYSAASTPRIGFLSPHIKATYESLIYTDLPFSEDVRQFVFNSLPVRQGCKVGKQFSPSEEQLSAVDDLITNMDLTKATVDEDGDFVEAFKPKNVFNPHLQRLYQCLQHRALNPDDLLADLNSTLSECLQPPQELKTKCADTCEDIKKLFKLEFIKPREDKNAKNIYKAVESMEPATKKTKVDEDLAGGMNDLTRGNKVTEVGPVTPVQDFQTMVSVSDATLFQDACNQMTKRITKLVMDSFGSQFFLKAMECAKVLRDECIKNEKPSIFNNFVKQFKNTLTENNKSEFWDMIVKDKLGLISKFECEVSGLSKQEADQFLAVVPKEEAEEVNQSADADDLLMQM